MSDIGRDNRVQCRLRALWEQFGEMHWLSVYFQFMITRVILSKAIL